MIKQSHLWFPVFTFALFMNRKWFGLPSRFIFECAYFIQLLFRGDAKPWEVFSTLFEEGCSPSFLMCLRSWIDSVWFLSWGCVSALIKMFGRFLLIISCDQSNGCYCKWHEKAAFWAWSLELATEGVFRLTLCTAIYHKNVNNVGMESWSFIA